MKFTEYYHSALRHLETCQLMFEKLSTIDNNKPLLAKKQRLKLDTKVSQVNKYQLACL